MDDATIGVIGGGLGVGGVWLIKQIVWDWLKNGRGRKNNGSGNGKVVCPMKPEIEDIHGVVTREDEDGAKRIYWPRGIETTLKEQATEQKTTNALLGQLVELMKPSV